MFHMLVTELQLLSSKVKFIERMTVNIMFFILVYIIDEQEHHHGPEKSCSVTGTMWTNTVLKSKWFQGIPADGSRIHGHWC